MCSRGVAVDAGKLGIVGRNLVTIRAYRTVMRDREPGVIKGRSCPRRRRVAGIAGRWVARGDVIGHRAAQSLRASPIRRVTVIAGRVRRIQQIIAADMAKGACRRQVSAGECPAS